MTLSDVTFQTRHVLTDDGKRIVYDRYSRGHRSVVILAPGFFNSRRAVLFKDMAADLSDEHDVIVMDFRGHGESQGPFTWTTKEYLDLKAVLDEIRKEYAQTSLIGFSLGAASSIIAAALDPQVDALIAVSAPSRFERVDFRFWEMDVEENILYNLLGEGRAGKGVWPGPWWLKKHRPVDMIGQVRCPTLFVHGGKDWLIRPWHSRVLFDGAVCPKRLDIIPGGTHAEFLFRRERGKISGIFKSWLKENLPQKPLE